MDAMKRYRWRGNIRELRNTVERLIIMTRRRSDRRAGSARRRSSRSDKAARPRPPGGTPAPLPPGSGLGRRHAARSSRSRPNARIWSRSCAKTLEHLEDGRSHRHAAQQPLQEARTVRDPAGDGRVSSHQASTLRSYRLPVSQSDSRPDSWHAAAARQGDSGRSPQAGRKVRTPQGSAPGNARSG